MESDPIIHLFPGAAFHEDGFIVGNRDGLEALAKHLKTCLETGGPEKFEGMTSDGEGYTVNIHLESERDVPYLAVPYTCGYAVETRENALYPWDDEKMRKDKKQIQMKLIQSK